MSLIQIELLLRKKKILAVIFCYAASATLVNDWQFPSSPPGLGLRRVSLCSPQHTHSIV